MASALHTDQYCLTMGQFYFLEGMDDEVSFELFVRSLPKTRGYLIAAGLGTALWHLRQFRFKQQEIDFLRGQVTDPHTGDPLYDESYLDYLRDLDFTCDVWAIPEGTPIGAQVPILRVTGPRIQATIIESLLLSIINHQTMIASKAARIIAAAQGRMVWDFSLRRLHGPEASLGVARAAYIAGAAGTATVEAGRILRIPTSGTMAHAQVMAFGEDREQEVFEKVLKAFPRNHALLIDTYDTKRGVERAIAASLATDVPLGAVRDDSGLEQSVPIIRAVLDGAANANQWFKQTKILASNDLDEFAIMRLANLPVDGYGVGTMLGTSADAPHLGGVYKLVEQDREPKYVMKLTEDKQTDPGVHQVWRTYSQNHRAMYDTLGLANENPRGRGGEVIHQRLPLLEQVMHDGRIVGTQPTLQESRAFCAEQLENMPAGVLDLENPEPWTLVRTPRLWELRANLGDLEAKQEVFKMRQEGI